MPVPTCDHGGDPVAACSHCDAVCCPRCSLTAPQGRLCAACVEALAGEIAGRRPRLPHLLLGGAATLIAAVVGALAWALVGAWTGQALLIAAPVVGLLCGRAALRGALGRGGPALAVIAVLATALGIVLGLVWTWSLLIAGELLRQGRDVPAWADPFWPTALGKALSGMVSSGPGLLISLLLLAIGLGVAWKQAGPLRFDLDGGAPAQPVAERSWTSSLLSLGFCLWVYAGQLGYPVAAVFLAVVVVHEFGHMAMARLLRLRVGKPFFLPYIGAFVTLQDRPRSTWADACVGWAGPITGLLTGGLPLLLLALGVGGPARPLLIEAAWFAGLLNLFNLVPAFGLDGDRMTRPCHGAQWAALLTGLAVLLAAAALFGFMAPVLPLVLAVGLCQADRRAMESARRRGDGVLARIARWGEPPDEALVTPARRWAATAIHLGLAAVLSALWAVAAALRG